MCCKCFQYVRERAGEREQSEGWGNLQVLRAQKERERCAVRARSMLEREREGARGGVWSFAGAWSA